MGWSTVALLGCTLKERAVASGSVDDEQEPTRTVAAIRLRMVRRRIGVPRAKCTAIYDTRGLMDRNRLSGAVSRSAVALIGRPGHFWVAGPLAQLVRAADS